MPAREELKRSSWKVFEGSVNDGGSDGRRGSKSPYSRATTSAAEKDGTRKASGTMHGESRRDSKSVGAKPAAVEKEATRHCSTYRRSRSITSDAPLVAWETQEPLAAAFSAFEATPTAWGGAPTTEWSDAPALARGDAPPTDEGAAPVRTNMRRSPSNLPARRMASSLPRTHVRRSAAAPTARAKSEKPATPWCEEVESIRSRPSRRPASRRPISVGAAGAAGIIARVEGVAARRTKSAVRRRAAERSTPSAAMLCNPAMTSMVSYILSSSEEDGGGGTRDASRASTSAGASASTDAGAVRAKAKAKRLLKTAGAA